MCAVFAPSQGSHTTMPLRAEIVECGRASDSLFDSKIGDAGAQALAAALPSCTAFTTLL